MPATQLAFALDASPASAPSGEVEALPHLRDEITRVWGLPLGERVEIAFHPSFPLVSIAGLLELRASPRPLSVGPARAPRPPRRRLRLHLPRYRALVAPVRS